KGVTALPSRSKVVALVTLALTMVFPMWGTHAQRGELVQDAVVQFGEPQPQNPNAIHVLVPDDVTIRRGGTVTFVVNGAGHGIAIYPVSKKTTRADIDEDLCQGGPTVCNGLTGTANLNYDTTDAKGDLIVRSGVNPPDPRVDDTAHAPRLLGTSGGVPGDVSASFPGAFLMGATPTTPGNRIQVRFDNNGCYLVICMNRSHYLNDHEFGFVSVVD